MWMSVPRTGDFETRDFSEYSLQLAQIKLHPEPLCGQGYLLAYRGNCRITYPVYFRALSESPYSYSLKFMRVLDFSKMSLEVSFMYRRSLVL